MMRERGPSPREEAVAESLDDELTPEADALLHERVRGGVPSAESLDDETGERLTWAFEHSPELSAYLRSESPITKLEEAREFVRHAAAERGLSADEAAAAVATTERVLNDVKRGCDRYSRTVDRMQRLKLQRFHLEDRRFAELLTAHDKTRRGAHDALADLCRSFNRYTSVVLYRRYGIDVPRDLLISDLIMRDRDRLRTWALTTDYYLRARSLVREIEERKRGQAVA